MLGSIGGRVYSVRASKVDGLGTYPVCNLGEMFCSARTLIFEGARCPRVNTTQQVHFDGLVSGQAGIPSWGASDGDVMKWTLVASIARRDRSSRIGATEPGSHPIGTHSFFVAYAQVKSALTHLHRPTRLASPLSSLRARWPGFPNSNEIQLVKSFCNVKSVNATNNWGARNFRQLFFRARDGHPGGEARRR